MSPQQLLLSWKDHNGALMSVFENLLKRNTLVDCTLAADGQYVKAHKVVLSACSSYFELLFSQESEKNPIVILKDVKFQELEAAVNFMYRGEVEVCEDRLAAFLEVADSLQIKGLGIDRKSQDAKGKSPLQKSSKAAEPPNTRSSRKDVALPESENTGESCITLDSDKNSNESSVHQLPHRETSGSSPIPSTLAISSSLSLPSASTSCSVRVETNRDRDKLEKNQCSSPSVSTFPSGDTVPPDVNTVIKIEPDIYLDEMSDESERDFDDVAMMEDQEDWDDPNIESMGDDYSSNQHDPVNTRGRQQRSSGQAKQVKGPAELHAAAARSRSRGGEPDACALTRGSKQRGTARVARRGGRFQCSHCGYATNRSSHWTCHHRVHTGEKPHKCTVCAYATTHIYNLNVHMRTHSGERPYKCTVCAYATTHHSNLNKHVRSIHTGK